MDTPPPSTELPTFDGAPITIDLIKASVPKNYALDDSLTTGFLELVNGSKSREEIAKGSIRLFTQAQEATELAIVKNWTETQTAWSEALRSDPEVGGEKLETSLKTAKELIATYAGKNAEEVMGLLDLTGLGNNVHMVRLLNALAKAVPGEAKPIGGDASRTEKSRADRLFGNKGA